MRSHIHITLLVISMFVFLSNHSAFVYAQNSFSFLSFSDNFVKKAEQTVDNINNQQDKLIVQSVAFVSHQVRRVGESVAASSLMDFSNIEEAVLGTPLFYPNPFRQSSAAGAILSYVLSKPFTFELHIYNMKAQRVFKQTYFEGGTGAQYGKNKLKFNKDSMPDYLLSSGVYFFVFVRNDKVLSKGKFVVKP